MAASRRMEFIARTQLTGTAASVSFATGLSGFTKFFLVAYIVNDANTKSLWLRFNADAGANYAYQYVSATGATVAGARVTGAAQVVFNTTAVLAASEAACIVIEISKPVAGEVARITARAGYNATIIYEASAAEWTNTADLINRIDVLASSNNITTGTRILLYGSRD